MILFFVFIYTHVQHFGFQHWQPLSKLLFLLPLLFAYSDGQDDVFQRLCYLFQIGYPKDFYDRYEVTIQLHTEHQARKQINVSLARLSHVPALFCPALDDFQVSFCQHYFDKQ